MVYSAFYPELKYETSRPRDFIGFDLLEKSDTTPRLTSIFRKRPSHIRETFCKKMNEGANQCEEREKLTLFVEALAFTTPRTSVEWMDGAEECKGRSIISLEDGVG